MSHFGASPLAQSHYGPLKPPLKKSDVGKDVEHLVSAEEKGGGKKGIRYVYMIATENRYDIIIPSKGPSYPSKHGSCASASSLARVTSSSLETTSYRSDHRSAGRNVREQRRPRYPDTTIHGTAVGLPISWGGARGVNVSIYGIHGVSGLEICMKFQDPPHSEKTPTPSRPPVLGPPSASCGKWRDL